ncbi:MAG: hypothetical protein ACOZF2_13035 [Thermodesulfobacteriota bacterium]
MQKATRFLAILLLGWCLPSCSSVPTYTIKVNGYTDPGIQTQVRPGGSFFIMENPEAQNPLLDKEIKEKLNKLLLTHGYPVTTFDRADFYLFYRYGMGEPRSVSVTTPDYYGGIGWGLGYGGWGWGWGGPAFYVGLPLTGYSTDVTPLYDRWLQLKVVEGPAYRTKKISRPVWVGEAHSLGASSDLRTVLTFLLVADFKEFGKNTGKAVTKEVNAQDPEAVSLTR